MAYEDGDTLGRTPHWVIEFERMGKGIPAQRLDGVAYLDERNHDDEAGLVAQALGGGLSCTGAQGQAAPERWLEEILPWFMPGIRPRTLRGLNGPMSEEVRRSPTGSVALPPIAGLVYSEKVW